ncbi:MAG: triosephosphate isomerase [Betaproteobacteria bacterium]|nr:triosephosphate isomerase [Betaproteobacteria bacterium]
MDRIVAWTTEEQDQSDATLDGRHGLEDEPPHGEVAGYAARLLEQLHAIDTSAIDVFVLPPYTSLGAAATAFGGTPVAIGAQNMHWEEQGAWTGEISAPMLLDAGCRYVELAHSERLQHFGETYERVRSKVDRALATGLTPIVCLGETAEDRREGRSDAVLASQAATALAGQPAQRVPDVVLAYEPRWAIGSSEAASPDYVAARHTTLRALARALRRRGRRPHAHPVRWIGHARQWSRPRRP